MQHLITRAAFAALAAIHVVALLLCGFATIGQRHGHIVDAFAGLCFAQTSLLALWFGLGPGLWWRRAAATAAGTAAVMLIFVYAVSRLGTSRDASWLAFVILQPSFVLAIVLLTLRRSGLTIRSSSPSDDQLQVSPILQFSVVEMLLFTLLLAFLLAGFALAKRALAESNQVNAVALLSACSSVLSMATVWLMLGRAFIRWRLIALPVGAAIIIASHYVAPEVRTMLGVQAGVMAATFVVLRICRLRLTVDSRPLRDTSAD